MADAAPPRFSIVAPLFDLRDAGWRALESALGQTFPRARYEVIAVGGERAPEAPAALLARCDRVVRVAVDDADADAEIALFDAGARAACGEFLYFIEGHTELLPDALDAFARALEADPGSDIVCGGRIDDARTRIGALIGAHNARHAARAARTGTFTLGANCIVRRSRFEALGGFDARFLRFNETVLYQRALAAGATVRTLAATLCRHHNDMPRARLVELLVATGRAKARYYAATLRDPGARVRVRHPIYRILGPRAAAALAALPLRIAGPLVIAAAAALVRRRPELAYRVFIAGVGCTDVAGFCFERALPDAWRRRSHAAAERRDAQAKRIEPPLSFEP
jgi:hypothetical protein